MKVRWTKHAEQQLYEIVDYIALDDPRALGSSGRGYYQETALRWVRRLRDRIKRAARMPGSGRRVPELGRDDIREVMLGNYRLMYRVVPRELIVLAVMEGHMLLHVNPDDG